MENEVKITRTFQAASSWRNIADTIREGNDGFISLGDEIAFTLKDGTDIVVQAAALNPYWENSVVFVMKDLLPVARRMNQRDTNDGGYPDCELRHKIAEEILPQFPDDLLDVIKPRQIRQRIGRQTVSCEDKLWIPSRKEMFDRDDGCDVDDVFFPLFRTQKSRVKALVNGNTNWYWLRSPTGGCYFRFVNYDGGDNYNFASAGGGVALSFII